MTITDSPWATADSPQTNNIARSPSGSVGRVYVRYVSRYQRETSMKPIKTAHRRSLPVIVGVLAAAVLPASVLAATSGPNPPTTPPAASHPPAGASGPLPRSWVASAGKDSNPCTRQAPCATFQRAFTQTSTGGQIDVVDSSLYSPVTITRAVTIKAVGVLAGIRPQNAQDGITIDCTDPTCRVVIDGLDLYGSANSTSTVDGIDILSAGAVRIQHSRLAQFPDAGIRFGPNNPECVLVVQDTTVSDNFPATVSDTNSGSTTPPSNNPPWGLLVTPAGADSSSNPLYTVTVRRSSFDDNSTGIGVFADPSQAVTVNVSHSEVADSYGYGIFTAGLGGAVVRLNANDITDNGVGVGIAASNTAGDHIDSFGNNNISGNLVDGNLNQTLSLRSRP
jgi:hypothetical protein